MNRMSGGVWQSLLLASLWMGCGTGNDAFTRVRDDVDSETSFFSAGRSGDSISSPYAAGALVLFSSQGVNPMADHSGWTAEVVDQNIGKVESVKATKSHIEVSVRMLAEGETRLRIFGSDKNAPLRSVAFQVKVATMMRIYAGTQMKTVAKEADVGELGDTIRLATSGETSFMVRLFNSGGELFGIKALTILDNGGTGPAAQAVGGTAFRVWRDWLVLNAPAVPGVWPRTLAVNGISMRTLNIHVVDPVEIASSQLYFTGEGKDGAKAMVIAEGKSNTGEAIYGGQYSWSLGGSAVDGTGDVFHYVVKTSSSKNVTATLAAGNASMNIHADKGTVGSTAQQSCAQSGPALWALWAVALGLLRRRKITPPRT